jgi:hypothetical protein
VLSLFSGDVDMDKLPKKRKAEMYRQEFDQWKSDALDRFGYFPIFQPFKETFLLRNLSGNALRLFIYLGLASGNKTGETWVSIETMAQYFDKSKRTISGWLKELEEVRLITRIQLNVNEVAHTFLQPYAMHLKDDENSQQKKTGPKNNKGGLVEGDE